MVRFIDRSYSYNHGLIFLLVQNKMRTNGKDNALVVGLHC